MSDSSFSGRRFIESIALDPEVTEGSLTISTKNQSSNGEAAKGMAEDGFELVRRSPESGLARGMLF